MLAGMAMVLRGQISGNNLFEYQWGNLPHAAPADLSAHYDQLNLQYRYKNLKAGLRYEHFFSQTGGTSYYGISQFNLRYRYEGLKVKAGHISEMLGNGLLFRAYEIPASVYEEEAYRVRYGFYRDLLGFSAQYMADHWYVKALRGRSLNNTLPPTLEWQDRRPDLAEGLEGGVSFFDQTAGVILFRNTNGETRSPFYSLLLEGNILAILSYNVEVAHNLSRDIAPFDFGSDARYGIYSSVSLNYRQVGLSVEFKNYQDMLIGSGVSDPPTLVKEHTYKLLNRSIHVPQYTNERGIQLEGYYAFSDGSRLLLNHARAVNEFTRTFLFTEYFAELTTYPGKNTTLTLFLDYAEDPFKGEKQRMTGGTLLETYLGNRWSGNLHAEYQHFKRTLGETIPVQNMAWIIGVSKSPSLSVSLTWEISDDPLQREAVGIPGKWRHWLGSDISYRLNNRNTLSLFVGQRRGGPACTSGICYEVLDFEGAEIRLTSKF